MLSGSLNDHSMQHNAGKFFHLRNQTSISNNYTHKTHDQHPDISVAQVNTIPRKFP